MQQSADLLISLRVKLGDRPLSVEPKKAPVGRRINCEKHFVNT